MNDERLVVVGTGIRTVGQMTMESIAWIKKADRVLYITSDPIAEEMIKTLNPSGAESLEPFYAENKLRLKTYHEMIDRTLDCLRAGEMVCMAAYGHPGVFAYPTPPCHSPIYPAPHYSQQPYPPQTGSSSVPPWIMDWVARWWASVSGPASYPPPPAWPPGYPGSR